ncbi:MAG: EamA family transporter [Micromonosporaceae bacterium]
MAWAAAVSSALAWGAADFCGGKASQRGDSRSIVLLSQLISVPVLGVGLLLTARGWPTFSDLGWGFGAGFFGAIGLMMLYRGLASGAMTVVAPVTGVTAAIVPVAVGLVFHQPPGAMALIGVGLAVAAIGLVTLTPRDESMAVSTRVLLLALVAGVGFGLFYVMLDGTSDHSGMWPLVGVRVASLVLSGVLVWQAGVSLRIGGSTLGWTVGAGVLDITANAAYVIAISFGLLTLVAPVASLYPVATVLLAFSLDREVIRPVQLAGIGLAATALVLVQVGS